MNDGCTAVEYVAAQYSVLMQKAVSETRSEVLSLLVKCSFHHGLGGAGANHILPSCIKINSSEWLTQAQPSTSSRPTTDF